MADQPVPGRLPRNGVSSRFAPQPNLQIFAIAVEDGSGRRQKIR